MLRAHLLLASTPRDSARFYSLLPRHTPSDQTVCDLTRKLAKGNTHPDPGGKTPIGRNKEFSMAAQLTRNWHSLRPRSFFHPPLLPPDFHHWYLHWNSSQDFRNPAWVNGKQHKRRDSCILKILLASLHLGFKTSYKTASVKTEWFRIQSNSTELLSIGRHCWNTKTERMWSLLPRGSWLGVVILREQVPKGIWQLRAHSQETDLGLNPHYYYQSDDLGKVTKQVWVSVSSFVKRE